MKHKVEFTYTFIPLLYLEGSMRTHFEETLRSAGSSTLFQGLRALQRRHQWALELPPGTFTNDYRPGSASREAEVAARDRQTALVIPKGWHTTRDVFSRDGVWFYRKPFLDRVRKLLEHNTILEAAYRFIIAAEADRTLIKGLKPRRPPLTAEERIARFGKMRRGPAWSREEDTVLRRWFSVRTHGERAGRHAKLSEEEWGYVLDAFNGMRTRRAILQRISYYNEKLRARYVREGKIVDGYISTMAARTYLQEVLGECPRLPPQCPTYKRSRRNDAPASPHVATTPTGAP